MSSVADKYFLSANLTPSSKDFLKRLNGAVESYCSSYLDDLKSDKYIPSSKIFQDSLWGFIKFSPAEMIIIDSPLVQRLRYIKQLGFAYLLFPNAGYSRFEHSLGVCHLIGEYIQTLKESQSHFTGNQVVQIEDVDIQILRLAALLHDIGHLSFSHVSERCWRFFAAGKAIDEIRSALRKTFSPRKKPSESEIIALCIILSPTVSNLLEICATKGWLRMDIRSAIEKICGYIIGSAAEPMRWFLTEMLNGDMDADKLDYIQRDCMVTGVPLPFDVKRLILKSRFVQGSLHRGNFVGLGISIGGARALLDLTVSRMMLHEKIYRHSKILTAESMFESALRLVSETRPDFLNPDSFLFAVDDAVLSALEGSPLDAGKTAPGDIGDNFQHARTLASNLKQRKLLKRAFVFSAHFLAEGGTAEDRTRLMTLVTDPRITLIFRKSVFEELKKILELLGRADYCPSNMEWIIIASTDLTGGAASQTQQPRIVAENGQEILDPEIKKYLSLQTHWANAYESSEAFHYVFCPEHIKIFCHIAVRNVLYKENNLIFKRSTLVSG